MTSDMPAQSPDDASPVPPPPPMPGEAPPAGWYDIAPDVQRWWDGRGWTDHYQAKQAEPPRQSTDVFGRPRPPRMITKQPVKTSHTFHLIMSILTCGIWAVLVWIPITVINAMRKQKVVTNVR